MIAWYWVSLIVAISLVIGSEVTSWYERKYKYNLNDLEKDALRAMRTQAAGFTASALDKLKELL